MELRTENWKEFKFGDLFEYQNKTKKIDDFKKQSVYDSTFCIPAISSTVINNSFGYYVKEADHEIIDKECISITSNGDAGKVYVQTIPFAIAQDAYVLFLKESLIEINIRKIYLFLAAVIEKKLIQKYSYTNKAVWSKVKNDIIKLPAVYNSDKKDYEPDWPFMEEYISFIENRYIDKIDEKNKEKIRLAMEVTGITEEELDGELVVEEPKRVNEFRVTDFFKLMPVQNDIDRNLISNSGQTNVYSSTTSNYGLMGYIDNEPFYKITNKNPYYIIFGDHTREFNFVYDSFCTTDNVKVLSPVIKSKQVNLYLLTAWKKAIPDLGYSRHWSKAKNIMLSLPAIDEKTPDFQYMENVIYIYIAAKIKDWKLVGEEKVRMLRKIILK